MSPPASLARALSPCTQAQPEHPRWQEHPTLSQLGAKTPPGYRACGRGGTEAAHVGSFWRGTWVGTEKHSRGSQGYQPYMAGGQAPFWSTSFQSDARVTPTQLWGRKTMSDGGTAGLQSLQCV